MALRDNEKLIATRNIPEVKDIKAENVVFTPTEDITSTNVQGAIEEVNDNASSIADDLSTHTDNTVVGESGLHGLRYFDGKLQAYVDGAWVDVGGSSLPWGATIRITSKNTGLADVTFNLTKDGEIVKSSVMSDTLVLDFTVLIAGAYTITYEDKSVNASVTLDNIFSNTVLSFTVGEIELDGVYKLEGCEWTCVAKTATQATLIMTKGDGTKGRMLGSWPGYVNNDYAYYSSDFGIGVNIMNYAKVANYYTGHKVVYDEIKKNNLIITGKGFYLFAYDTTDRVKKAYQTAAINYLSFKADAMVSDDKTWTGTVAGGGTSAKIIHADGTSTSSGGQSGRYVIAPAFDLDTSKVYLDGNEIKIL